MENDTSGVAPEIDGVAATSSADANALVALAERYRLLVELSPDAIVVHENGRVVYVNPAGVRYSRVASATDLIGRPITDFVHPDSIPGMVERILALTAEGDASEPSEAVMLRGDGEPIESEVVSVRTVWDGRPAFQVIMRDITAQKAADAALRFQAALVDHVSDAVIAVTTDGIVETWNSSAERIYGRTSEAAVGSRIENCVGAAVDPKAIVALGGTVDAVHHRRNGDTVDVRVSVASTGSGFVVMCADETAGRRADQRFHSVVSTLHEGVIVVGPDETIELANPAAIRLLGLADGAVPGASIHDVAFHTTSSERRDGVVDPVLLALRTGRSCDGTVVRLRRSDSDLWLSVSCRALDPGEPHSSVVVSFADVTTQHTIAERHRYDATHDPLTGLANRAGIIAYLDDPTRCADDARIVVNFIDLDNFKAINDSRGHLVGDEVLCIVGQRLRSAVRNNDLVGRLGGDEFVVISRSDPGDPSIRAQADRLRTILGQSITIDGEDLHVDASVGITTATTEDERSSLDLLRDADTALYSAKSAGRAQHAMFSVELRDDLHRRRRFDNDFRDNDFRDDDGDARAAR
ncbi:diguanylate cyclase domain-containing protein [Antrihabitans cavernicola]|uniref:Diguanylate cyclase n=1 Tax=Antrihabitans cavernicola TaxID=2495913 RepID=A0A5A7SD68_9NOCA|nr:diguanylate cyclase [Spelaeibacter cavernicola]KAA0024098.1 diguanylate cyclase [Spelaeibacter cavernicola]